MAIKKQTVNWKYQGKDITSLTQTPQGSISFIYRINLEDGTGRYYIGRKTMLKPNYTSGVNKGKSKGEYPWKSYNGSSKELLAILKTGIPYSKEIIKFCYSKAETTFEESAEIICGGALKDPLAFNYWIKCTIYSKHLTTKEN